VDAARRKPSNSFRMRMTPNEDGEKDLRAMKERSSATTF
jgi:hypothetical protein